MRVGYEESERFSESDNSSNAPKKNRLIRVIRSDMSRCMFLIHHKESNLNRISLVNVLVVTEAKQNSNLKHVGNLFTLKGTDTH